MGIYISRIQDNDCQTKDKQDELSKKYKTMTATYHVEFLAVLIYGLISSILQAITTPIIKEDVIAFFAGLWNGIIGLYNLIEKLGHSAAGFAYLTENPTASGILYWTLHIIVMVVLIGVILFGLGFMLFLYGGYVRENQWDRHTVLVIIADVSITLFLAEEIKEWIPVNLFVIQMLLLLMYSVIRTWVQHSRNTY